MTKFSYVKEGREHEIVLDGNNVTKDGAPISHLDACSAIAEAYALGARPDKDKPEMTKKTYVCPKCFEPDQHLFLTHDNGHVCSKCYEKLEGVEP